MTAGRMPERRSGGYSLDEAARLEGMIQQSDSLVECPQCKVTMQGTGGADREGAVWILHCASCGRGVVLRVSASLS